MSMFDDFDSIAFDVNIEGTDSKAPDDFDWSDSERDDE